MYALILFSRSFFGQITEGSFFHPALSWHRIIGILPAAFWVTGPDSITQGPQQMDQCILQTCPSWVYLVLPLSQGPQRCSVCHSYEQSGQFWYLAFDSHSDKNGNIAILGETKKIWIFLFLAAGPSAYTPIFLTLITLKYVDQFLPSQVVVG